jgi:hypothetical protein
LKDYGGGKKETNPKYLQAMKNVRNVCVFCFSEGNLFV